MMLLAVLLAFSSPGPAQSDWRPPSLELARLSPLFGAAPLHTAVLQAALPKMAAKDFRGLGAEAAQALSWTEGKTRAALRGQEGSWSLQDDAGARLPLSAALGSALRHANEYFMMTPATLERPVTHEELKAALLSEAGAARVRAIFDRAIAERVETGKSVAVPELGGEATLDGGAIELHEMPEMTRPVMQLISRNANDPAALARIAEEHPEEVKALDEMGLLQRLLKSLPEWEKKGVSQQQRDKVLALTVETVLENGADSYVWDPETQFAAIADQSWSGRYVGKWHTHPPGSGSASWSSSGCPSGPDMDIAVKDGQNLVLSFQTDGFDAYDLSPLENGQPDLRKVLKISYRSEAWRRHFQASHDEVFPKPGS
ncbi:MAG: hypothetical protein HY926_08245 [Elusimicrobia bacterium]|nr:hypothetical protein [Elusimicrobiota bacterium]